MQTPIESPRWSLWAGSVNSPFWKAAIQLEFLINVWCAANIRPNMLRRPTAALAEEETVSLAMPELPFMAVMRHRTINLQPWRVSLVAASHNAGALPE